MLARLPDIEQITRIVVKVGTNVLMGGNSESNRTPDVSLIREITKQIVTLQKKGKEVILISSGSIGFGAAELAIQSPVVDISTRQACAAVGQPILMQIYKQIFQELDTHCAQLLLTGNDFNSKTSYEALHNCIEVLLASRVIPIINENDSVSIEEIGYAFGDNDNLSALVASKINAKLLVLLTDVDALYDKNPKKHKDAKRIEVVEDVESLIAHYSTRAEEVGSSVGTGGIGTKLQAALVAKQAGCNTIIAQATRETVLLEITEGKRIGTIFL